MEMVELSCKKCGAPIDSKDIHLGMGLARCSHCSTIFSLKKPAESGMTGTTSTKRAPVAMPKNIEAFDTGTGLQLTYHWYSAKYIGMIVFTLFWNGFMCVWHAISLSQGAYMMSVFGLLHTAIGIGVAYFTLAGFLNRTTVTAEMGMLTIRHAPLPWPGNKQLWDEQFEQLFSKEKVSHSKNGTNYSYEVHVALRDGEQVKLLGGLDKAEQALFIEQELERYLGIADKPVRGEIPR